MGNHFSFGQSLGFIFIWPNKCNFERWFLHGRKIEYDMESLSARCRSLKEIDYLLKLGSELWLCYGQTNIQNLRSQRVLKTSFTNKQGGIHKLRRQKRPTDHFSKDLKRRRLTTETDRPFTKRRRRSVLWNDFSDVMQEFMKSQ